MHISITHIFWVNEKGIHAMQFRTRRRGLSALMLTFGMAFSAPTYPEYLGNYGNLWAIEEPDGVEQLKDKLREMERSGELEQHFNKFRDDTLASIENPEPVPGIATATFPRTYLLDPSVTVQENVMDDQGRLMVLAGTRINPLQYMNWSKSVLLIDARDERQVRLALERLEHHPKDKIILVAGSYTEFMRKHKKQVFYDLGGVFTTRFNIKVVPTLVSQEGRNLLVQEIAFSQEESVPMVMPLPEGVQPVVSDWGFGK